MDREAWWATVNRVFFPYLFMNSITTILGVYFFIHETGVSFNLFRSTFSSYVSEIALPFFLGLYIRIFKYCVLFIQCPYISDIV